MHTNAGSLNLRIGILQDLGQNPYWTKYARFALTNNLSHGVINIHRSDWREQVSTYNLIVGRPASYPAVLEEMKRKVFLMESAMRLTCYPSLKDLQIYEDKHVQYELLRIFNHPVIPTIVSYDYEEAIERAKTLDYPVVSKLITGSGSMGVELVQSPAGALKIIREAFSRIGRFSYWGYVRQKDYVLFQQYVENDGYDIRVIVVDNHVFGYYRKAGQNDFRASGSGVVEKRGLPEPAIRIARKVAADLNQAYLSVDFLKTHDNQYLIIEMAQYNSIETAEQLQVNNTAGAYVFDSEDRYTFVPGRFWLQELALRKVCCDSIERMAGNGSAS